ncbi:MAG: HEAT repeat domain-containing protein [Asgard group archaeon]|nr:HEAT repeat domain-containing protein [Asgard group archaeon]
MHKFGKTITKIGFLLILVLVFTPLFSISSVNALNEFNGEKTIRVGYVDAYTYTIDNYKNQRFTIQSYFNETVNPAFELIVLCTIASEWDSIQNGSTTLANMTHYLQNYSVSWGETYVYEVVIPDWEEWTFVFLNLNGASMLTQLKIDRQHVLWWLWIVIPLLVIIGLTTYGIVENVTRYERARMDDEKAVNKLKSKNEGERKRASYWLISNGDKQDLEILEGMLEDDNPVTRENVAFAIGGISKRLGDKSLTKKIIAKYQEEKDGLVKEELVLALANIGAEEAIPILEKYLISESNEKLRFSIAKSLGEIGSSKAVPVLRKIIESENTDTLKIASQRSLEQIAKKKGVSVEELK